MQAKLGYRRYDRTWEEDNYSNGGDLSLASHNGAVQNIIPADVSLNLAHGTWGKLTLGSDFQHADYQTYTDSGHRVIGNDGVSDQYGLYAQEQLTLDQWVLRGGGRVNRITQDIDLLSGVEPGDNHAAWNKFLWSAGTRYNGWAPVAPFANVGTSFMAPSLKSVGGTLQASDRGVAGRNGQLPNPDLQPEKGVGGDFGVDFQLAKQSLLTLRTFANVIDDAIVENVVSKTPSQSQSVNAGKTTALGFEAALKCRLTDWVDGFANYTYTHSRISNSIDHDQDGATVPFVPENMGDVGVTLLLPGNLTISPSLHWSGSIYDSSSLTSRQKFDSYELVNVMVRKGLIRDGKRSVDLYLELYNITNNHYEMPWQFQDPGFSAMAGIQATFYDDLETPTTGGCSSIALVVHDRCLVGRIKSYALCDRLPGRSLGFRAAGSSHRLPDRERFVRVIYARC
ncbi:MAG: TonB-dependent receptor [Kiritimatiellaeota bacterium]|nr:TonB-dependent receptor [Kiritimatiellota bacterium]